MLLRGCSVTTSVQNSCSMSIIIPHCVHQPCHRSHAPTNEAITLHHHSLHPTPILSVPYTPTLSKNPLRSRLTKPLALAAPETHDEQPNIRPFIHLLKTCDENGYLKQAKSIHGHVLKSGFGGKDLLVFLNNTVHVYSKCLDYNSARKVFDGMSRRNVFTWTVMIVASNEHGYYHDGVELFSMMLEQGVLLDGFVLSAVLQSCVGLDSIEFGNLMEAKKIFEKKSNPDVVTWTAIISTYAHMASEIRVW